MPASSYTRSTARTVVQREMQDDTGTYLTSTIVNALLNDAMAQVAEDTRCRRATTTIDVNAGQAEYDLTSVAPRILDILSVALPPSEDDTNEQPLAFATLEDLQRQDASWRQTTGQPYAYTRYGQGFTKIRLYPEPTGTYTAVADASAAVFSGLYGLVATLAGDSDSDFDASYGSLIDAAYKYGSLRIDYVAASTDLDDDADELEADGGIPVQFQDAVIWYACARACEGDVPIAQQEKAQTYWAKYAAEIASAKALAENSFQSSPPRQTVTEWF